MSYEYHPLASIFPLMRGAALQALANDIKLHDRIENPITLFEDMILDGRNRQRACDLVGVTPDYDAYEGDDPLGFVISLNAKRRQLSEGATMLAAAKLADLPHGVRADYRAAHGPVFPITQAEAGERLGVGERSVRRAKEILDSGNERLIEAIEDGKVTVRGAAEILALDLDADELDILLLNPPEEIVKQTASKKKERKRKAVEDKIIADAAATAGWPSGRYAIFYADPPWEDEFGPAGRDVENHYPVMSIEELRGLEVPELSTPDSVLYLWAMAHNVEEALALMTTWGFTYRSQAVWVKDKIGLGEWFRQQHEILLVGRKGEFPTPPESLRISSVINAPRLGHSEKPEIVIESIERWYPTLPKVELFRRGPPRKGWSAWGNQALKAAE